LIHVIIAADWPAYGRTCHRRGLDPNDRKTVIPLIQDTDRYRLWGRRLRGAKVIKVGDIDERLLSLFKSELLKAGWRKGEA
jgi:hypothetical protein